MKNINQIYFNELYDEIDGYQVSRLARQKHGETKEKLLYGEVPFEVWNEIISFMKPKDNSTLFDLGSGTGKIVMQSLLTCNFSRLVGIEMLELLHEKAVETFKNFEKNIKPRIENFQNKKVEFICKSIFDCNLSDADFIFMNQPFRGEELYLELEKKFLNELKIGTKIVTIIRSLRNPRFKNLQSKKFNFSWGLSTAHFFEVIE